MDIRHWMFLGTLSALMSLSAAPLAAQQQQDQSPQSVAEAARKAREQKKAAKKPAKVYTDDDVNHASPAGAAGQGTGAAPSQAGAPAGQAGEAAAGAGTLPGEEKKDEAYWRKRFKEAHAQLARAQKELDVLQRELDRGQVRYYSDPTKAMNEQFSSKEINDKQAKIAAKNKEIADLQQKLDDMEDELRKAGGDPGWARE